MNDGSFTPFFVADRQASLRILMGLKGPLDKRIGVMTHANAFAPFKRAIAEFPCFDMQNCGIYDGKCPFDGQLTECSRGQLLKRTTCIICDSGVFQRKGCEIPTYEKLFKEYESMGADYGVIMDVLKDRKRTVRTAKEAMQAFRTHNWSFRLVGVSQGTDADEYLKCYKELKSIGYKYIAIGGMLQRREKSARYVTVRDETLLRDVLKAIRVYDPKGWIFALGCYSPGRHTIFLENSVFGADYKGWIFNYAGHSPGRGNKRSQRSRFRQVRSFVAEEILTKPQNWGRNHRLLIIPCSKSKRVYKGLAQAINVYDGPVYRMLRKRVRDFSNENGSDIMIVSSKYGLITPTTLIARYDQKMTIDRAVELKPKANEYLSKLMMEKKYADVLVNLGSEYLAAVEPSLWTVSKETRVRVLQGKIGTRLHETRAWLSS
jgi:hypothetical protein